MENLLNNFRNFIFHIHSIFQIVIYESKWYMLIECIKMINKLKQIWFTYVVLMPFIVWNGQIFSGKKCATKRSSMLMNLLTSNASWNLILLAKKDSTIECNMCLLCAAIYCYQSARKSNTMFACGFFSVQNLPFYSQKNNNNRNGIMRAWVNLLIFFSLQSTLCAFVMHFSLTKLHIYGIIIEII